jgi:quinoprotein glucose dehydrogenase
MTRGSIKMTDRTVSAAGLLLASVALAAVGQENIGATTNDGIFTAAQAALGERSFTASCASCHGADMAGREGAPSLAGDAFLRRWQNRSVGELFDRISTSMPQQQPHSLGDTVYIAIVAYIIQANGFPDGSNILTPNPTALGALKIAPIPK